ncbi:hypothetical protein H0H92_010306, partial [Tricholoma furcatifolium]
GFHSNHHAYIQSSRLFDQLTAENTELRIQLKTTRELYGGLLTKLEHIGASTKSTTVHTFKLLPPPLNPNDFSIRFWTEKAYEEFIDAHDGETDGNATEKPRRGRPPTTGENEKHLYLESSDGKPVDQYRLRRFGDKARQLFESLRRYNMAPEKWKSLDNEAYDYFKIEMLNKFQEFRLCDGNWKLDTWAAKTYASWTQKLCNKGESGELEQSKKKENQISKKSKLTLSTPSANSAPESPVTIDNANLFKMDELPTPSEDTTPVETFTIWDPL